jgi:hypothetical protein
MISCFSLTLKTRPFIICVSKKQRRINVNYIPSTQQPKKKEDTWLFKTDGDKRRPQDSIKTQGKGKEKTNGIGAGIEEKSTVK